MNSNNIILLRNTLSVMNEKAIPLEKIVIQKTVFYLSELGVPFTYRFKPYTYGPFSFDLMDDMNDLVFWDKLNTRGNNRYMVAENISSVELSDNQNFLSDKIDRFIRLVNKKFDFKNMELFGTAIYCYRAFQEVGSKIAINKLITEFKLWKKNKFSDSEIKMAFEKIDKIFSIT